MERADSTDPPTNDLTIFEATEFRNSLVTLLEERREGKSVWRV